MAGVAGLFGLDLVNNQHLCDILWPVYIISGENEVEYGVGDMIEAINGGNCGSGGNRDNS